MILPEDITSRRIIGLEINFTDNAFGDKDPTIGRIVDPFGTGTKSGASFFTSNFTSDNQFDEEPTDPKLIMKRSEKAVPKSLQAVPPDQVLLPGFKAVDVNAKILEDDEIKEEIFFPTDSTSLISN